MVELDEGNSVPGYTLIKVYCPTNNFILSYEADLLNLSNYSNNELWAQWNKQPLNYIFGEENNSDVQYYPPNDCNTSFALKNKASELYLSFGNVYPYDGIITSHYGYANWVDL